jgi:phage protein U
MSVKFSNNAKTTLSSGITSSATSIAVADASVFPSISGSEYFYVTFEDLNGNVEIVKVTAVSSNTLTVVRAQESTTARAYASGDKAENRLTAGSLNDVATQADTDTNTTYSAGSGLSLSGTTFSNSAPDQTVSLTGAGATTISGTYPNFTVTSTDTNTTYSVGDGGLTQNNFTNALKSKLEGIEASADVTDTANVVGALTAGTNVTIASDGTISSTDTNTTYSAGSGISLSGTTFSNSAPDQTVSITGAGATSISGTYPNFTVTSTDTNTTYAVGDGGLTQKNFTTTLKDKLDGIASGAEVNVNADWSASSGDAQILNKPTIPSLSGYATESYVNTQVSNLVDSSPSTLNTLNELAAALGDDANFSTTVTNSIATKLPLAGGTMTGAITFASGQSFDGRDVSADGAKLDGIEASADVTDTANVVSALTAGTNVTIASDGTVSATDTNTTYSAGSGISLSGTTFSNSAPDQTVSLTGAGATTISGTYPNFTITSTDTNTTYSVGDGGLTQNNFTDADHAKLNGIEANANNYTLPSNVGTQSVVTTAPTSATGFANGHVWYVV